MFVFLFTRFCLRSNDVLLLRTGYSTSIAGNAHVLHASILLLLASSARESTTLSWLDENVSSELNAKRNDGAEQILSSNFGRKWRGTIS